MLRELGQECPLPSELLEEGLLGLAGEVSRYLQAFHGNGVLEREMPPSVHDTEAALAHDAVNAVALVDDRADQAKNVFGHWACHGTQLRHRRPWHRSHQPRRLPWWRHGYPAVLSNSSGLCGLASQGTAELSLTARGWQKARPASLVDGEAGPSTGPEQTPVFEDRKLRVPRSQRPGSPSVVPVEVSQ